MMQQEALGRYRKEQRTLLNYLQRAMKYIGENKYNKLNFAQMMEVHYDYQKGKKYRCKRFKSIIL